MNKLEPCPICKGDAVDLGHGIQCRKCGLWLGKNYNDYSVKFDYDHVKVWNKRAK